MDYDEYDYALVMVGVEELEGLGKARVTEGETQLGILDEIL